MTGIAHCFCGETEITRFETTPSYDETTTTRFALQLAFRCATGIHQWLLRHIDVPVEDAEASTEGNRTMRPAIGWQAQVPASQLPDSIKNASKALSRRDALLAEKLCSPQSILQVSLLLLTALAVEMNNCQMLHQTAISHYPASRRKALNLRERSFHFSIQCGRSR